MKSTLNLTPTSRIPGGGRGWHRGIGGCRIAWISLAWILADAGRVGAAEGFPPAPVLPSTARAAASPAAIGPRLEFDRLTYDFGRVAAGSVVSCEFVYRNTGDQVLEIRDVRPSCGCTTASNWKRQLAPGESSQLAFQLNTANFSGPLHKTVMVTSSAAGQPSVVLQLQGTVWKPIDVTPSYVIYSAITNLQAAETRSVRIVNNTDDPVDFKPPQINNPRFRAELKAVRPGKEFELVIQTVPPLAYGAIQAVATLQPSTDKLPPVQVTVFASVVQPVQVNPQHIVLPAGPLPNVQARSIIVRNSTEFALKLSNPKILNAENVTVTVQETLAGKVFNIALAFPALFEVPQGKNVLFSIETNHPDFPRIEVPVLQIRLPSVPAPVAAPPSAATPAIPGLVSPAPVIPPPVPPGLPAPGPVPR